MKETRVFHCSAAVTRIFASRRGQPNNDFYGWLSFYSTTFKINNTPDPGGCLTAGAKFARHKHKVYSNSSAWNLRRNLRLSSFPSIDPIFCKPDL